MPVRLLRRAVDHALREELRDLAHRPFVSVENLTRIYEPVQVRRIQRAMAIFGGLGVGYAGQSAVDEDDDEDLDDDDEDVRPKTETTTVALDRVSFVAGGGTCVALVGPADAGKTTLLRIIAGIAPPTSGRAVVHGLVAPAMDCLGALFPKYGYLDRALTGLGAFVGLPARRVNQHRAQIFELYGQADLGKEPVKTAPRQAKKDLIFAMMLVVDADIVLVDFSPQRQPNKARAARMQQRLQEIRQSGALILIAARDVESVAWIADRVLFMEKGSIIDDLPIDEALARTVERDLARPSEGA